MPLAPLRASLGCIAAILFMFIIVFNAPRAGAEFGFTPPAVLNADAATDDPSARDADMFPIPATNEAGTWITTYSTDKTLRAEYGDDFDMFFARYRQNETDFNPHWAYPAALNSNATTDTGNDGSLAYTDIKATGDSQGHWVAVWESNQQWLYDDEGTTIVLGSDYDIFFARSDNDGTTWTAPQPLCSAFMSDTGDDWMPQLATDGAGKYICVWATYNDVLTNSDDTTISLGGDGDLLYCVSTDNGQTWSDAKPLNTDFATDDKNDNTPTLATDRNGHWVVAWMSSPAGQTPYYVLLGKDILVSRYDEDTDTWSDPASVLASPPAENEVNFVPNLACDRIGHWVLTWTRTPDLYETLNLSVVAASSSDNGESWSEARLIGSREAPAYELDYLVSVTSDGMGNWLATWSESGFSDLVGSNIYLSRSVDTGDHWTTPSLVISGIDLTEEHPKYNFFPRVITDRLGNWLITWASTDDLGLNIGSDYDILFSFSNDLNSSLNQPRHQHEHLDLDLIFENSREAAVAPAAALPTPIPGSPEYLVRVVYVVPSDRSPDLVSPNFDDATARIRTALEAVNDFYAYSMEQHGAASPGKQLNLERESDGQIRVIPFAATVPTSGTATSFWGNDATGLDGNSLSVAIKQVFGTSLLTMTEKTVYILFTDTFYFDTSTAPATGRGAFGLGVMLNCNSSGWGGVSGLSADLLNFIPPDPEDPIDPVGARRNALLINLCDDNKYFTINGNTGTYALFQPVGYNYVPLKMGEWCDYALGKIAHETFHALGHGHDAFTPCRGGLMWLGYFRAGATVQTIYSGSACANVNLSSCPDPSNCSTCFPEANLGEAFSHAAALSPYFNNVTNCDKFDPEVAVSYPPDGAYLDVTNLTSAPFRSHATDVDTSSTCAATGPNLAVLYRDTFYGDGNRYHYAWGPYSLSKVDLPFPVSPSGPFLGPFLGNQILTLDGRDSAGNARLRTVTVCGAFHSGSYAGATDYFDSGLHNYTFFVSPPDAPRVSALLGSYLNPYDDIQAALDHIHDLITTDGAFSLNRPESQR